MDLESILWRSPLVYKDGEPSQNLKHDSILSEGVLTTTHLHIQQRTRIQHSIFGGLGLGLLTFWSDLNPKGSKISYLILLQMIRLRAWQCLPTEDYRAHPWDWDYPMRSPGTHPYWSPGLKLGCGAIAIGLGSLSHGFYVPLLQSVLMVPIAISMGYGLYTWFTQQIQPDG